MLVLIWLLVGVLLGMFVVWRSVAFGLAAALWAIVVATIAAREGAPWQYGADSVGVFATLAMALLGALLGSLLRRRPFAHASHLR